MDRVNYSYTPCSFNIIACHIVWVTIAANSLLPPLVQICPIAYENS